MFYYVLCTLSCEEGEAPEAVAEEAAALAAGPEPVRAAWLLAAALVRSTWHTQYISHTA